LRAFQFVARFNLSLAPETVSICRQLSPMNLALERIWGEWEKWARQAVAPARGLKLLEEVHWLRFWSPLAALPGTPQDPTWHPEGDVWEHTCRTCDAMVTIARERNLDLRLRQVLLLASLCHDFGKPATSQRIAGRWRSPGHERGGERPATEFLEAIGAPRALIAHVVPLVARHMSHMHAQTWTDRAVRRLALRLDPATVEELVLLIEADGRACCAGNGSVPLRTLRASKRIEALLAAARRLEVATERPKPLVLGRHLLPHGLSSGPDLGQVLEATFEAQLDGAFESLPEGVNWALAYAARHGLCPASPVANSDAEVEQE
jgi:tRNA nucleotidyltransferase (CCA-adding enzyme)